MKEISVAELHALPKDSYVLIDIRDEGLRDYGIIEDAIALDIEADDPFDQIAEIPPEKKLIFYCDIGRQTRDLDEAVFPGRDCYSLEGGYVGYVRASVAEDSSVAERQERAEHSIQKKYHNWQKVFVLIPVGILKTVNAEHLLF